MRDPEKGAIFDKIKRETLLHQPITKWPIQSRVERHDTIFDVGKTRRTDCGSMIFG